MQLNIAMLIAHAADRAQFTVDEATGGYYVKSFSITELGHEGEPETKYGVPMTDFQGLFMLPRPYTLVPACSRLANDVGVFKVAADVIKPRGGDPVKLNQRSNLCHLTMFFKNELLEFSPCYQEQWDRPENFSYLINPVVATGLPATGVFYAILALESGDSDLITVATAFACSL